MRIWTIAALVAAFVCAPVAASAQSAPERTLLSIVAEGRSEAPPDLATINLGVETTGATAEAAMSDNSRNMSALIAALRRAGVAERNIQTSRVSVQPQYNRRRDDEEEPRIVGYRATNSVSVEIQAIETTGRVLDAAIAAGGNSVRGVTFSHQDPSAQQNLARREAAAEARRRADLYAGAFGLRVVRVVAIAEPGASTPETIVVTGTRIARHDAVAESPIETGEITTRATLTVTYELR